MRTTRHRSPAGAGALGRLIRRLLFFGFVAGLFTHPAVAQTSSWSHRITPEPLAKAPARSAPNPPPKAVVPRAPGAAGPAAQRAVSTKTIPAAKRPDQPLPQVDIGAGKFPDNDPAYTAFDLGRYLTALSLAEAAAAKGEPQAHTLIGRIHAEGLGIGQNLHTAAQWYAKAAELGDTEGAFAVGVLLVQGRGVEKDLVLGARYLEAAAAKGHALAVYNLALLFLRGEGKPENPMRAFRLMEYAAEKGVVSAQYDLGTLYATGSGTTANVFEAARWIGRAALAGHPEAEVEYGILLFKGHGAAPDPVRGAHFFASAARKGNPIGQNRFARCLTHGAGVEKSLPEAAKWHLIAKAAGVEDKDLDQMVARLGRADRLAAEQAAHAWRERALVQ